MNIQEALKQTVACVTYGVRWLECDSDGDYRVYQYAQKRARLIIKTNDEEKAVEALLELAEEER